VERAYEERDVLLSAFITVDPIWDRLRANPRFVGILKGMNIEAHRLFFSMLFRAPHIQATPTASGRATC
jgi:hypothetical protein